MSLRRKLILPLVLVALPLLGYLHFVWIGGMEADAEANHLRLIASHQKSVAEGLVPLVLGSELDSIHGTLDQLQATNPDWVWLTLVDQRGRQLYPLASRLPAPRRPGQELRTIDTTLEVGGRRIGTLAAQVDIAPLLDSDRRHFRELSLGLSLMFAVLMAAVVSVLELAVRRPVAQLAHASKALSRRIFDAPLPRAGSDEIGALVECFASMRTALRDHDNERRAAEETLRRAVDALTESNAELERFAHVASHDLQEPIRTLVSYSQLLERRFGDVLDKDGRDFVEFITSAAKRMQRLVQDLLVYSRVTTQARPFEPVPLAKPLTEALENLQVAIEDNGAVIEADTAAFPAVMGDPIQLVQVFQNLVINAIKFRGSEPPRIRVTAERQGNGAVEVAVADNGVGIPADHLDDVFVIFRRLHGPATPGSGLGLALCQRIVQRHGGRIWAESEEGKGTTFRFTLPAGF